MPKTLEFDLQDEQRARALVLSLLREFMAPPERLSVTEWAEKYRTLSAKDSAEPGPYRVSRIPYALEPQNALTADNGIETVTLMWGAQTSKTTIGTNWIGYIIDQRPGPVMIVQPTLDIAKRYSRQRLTPAIDESPRLRYKVRKNSSRDDANTMLLKEFTGGFLVIAGANSAAGLRSMPIRDIFFDETDAYPQDVDGEGDPIELAKARQTTYARRKSLRTSTPTTKGASRVENDFEASDQRYYHIPCPHCGELQRLVWGAGKDYGLKWHKDAQGRALPDTAHYVCQHGCIIDEHHKAIFLVCEELGGRAKWLPANPSADPKHRSYHLSSLYSPLGFLTWAELVIDWQRASDDAKNGDQAKMRAFINTRLAETWEEQGDKIVAHELGQRAEDYAIGIAPMGVLMCTMGVDVQPNRLECRVWGYGRGEESWLIQRHIIYGDPNIEEAAEGSPWRPLSELRSTLIPHASGAQMPIEAVGIDTGGANTNACYHYARAHAHAHVLALKGASTRNKPVIGKPAFVDISWRGKTLKRSLKLWSIGTDTAKTTLYGRLRLQTPGPGYVHLPAAYAKQDDEFEQLTAEKLVTRYIKGFAIAEWQKPSGKRNEALDCAVYAYAAACYLGLQTLRETAWAKREARYSPQTQDLFAHLDNNDNTQSIPPTETATSTAKAHPRRQQYRRDPMTW